MSEPQYSKEQWVEKAYQEICRLMGQPKDENETKNLREYAESLHQNYVVEAEEWEKFKPEDAVEEDLSYC